MPHSPWLNHILIKVEIMPHLHLFFPALPSLISFALTDPHKEHLISTYFYLCAKTLVSILQTLHSLLKLSVISNRDEKICPEKGTCPKSKTCKRQGQDSNPDLSGSKAHVLSSSAKLSLYHAISMLLNVTLSILVMFYYLFYIILLSRLCTNTPTYQVVSHLPWTMLWSNHLLGKQVGCKNKHFKKRQ